MISRDGSHCTLTHLGMLPRQLGSESGFTASVWSWLPPPFPLGTLKASAHRAWLPARPAGAAATRAVGSFWNTTNADWNPPEPPDAQAVQQCCWQHSGGEEQPRRGLRKPYSSRQSTENSASPTGTLPELSNHRAKYQAIRSCKLLFLSSADHYFLSSALHTAGNGLFHFLWS